MANNTSFELVEALFLESCTSFMIAKYPIIEKLMHRNEPEPVPVDEAKSDSRFMNMSNIWFCMLTVIFLTFIFYRWPISFKLPMALKKFRNFKINYFKPSTATAFSILSTSSQESVVVISQEWIQEWQKLFHKAKLLDSIMIKQILKHRKRYAKNNIMLPKSHSKNSYVDHALDHKTIKTVGIASYSPSDKFRSDKALYIRSFNKPNASDNLQSTVDGKLPMFVSTEELLEIKRQPYDTGESNC